jgi:hypothetical protein
LFYKDIYYTEISIPSAVRSEFVNGIFIYKSLNKKQMKKQFLLFLAIACSLVTFGQNHKQGWDISVGPTLHAPLAGKIDWDSKAWGQKVQFSKNNMNLSFGFMQNKGGFVQMPVLVGYRKHLKKNLHVGLDGGMTFFDGQKGQFTYVPSVGLNFHKKWCLEQSILRTVKDGKHSNQVGLTLLYKL